MMPLIFAGHLLGQAFLVGGASLGLRALWGVRSIREHRDFALWEDELKVTHA